MKSIPLIFIGLMGSTLLYAGVPAAPTDVNVRVGNARADVTWTAPTDTSGLLVTSYTATASPGGLSCSVTGSPADANCTITGLTNDTPYTVSVTATTADGASPASTPSNVFTPLNGIENINLINAYGRVKRSAGTTGGIDSNGIDQLVNYNWGQATSTGYIVQSDGTIIDGGGTPTSSTLNCTSSWQFQQVLCDMDSGTTPAGKNEHAYAYKPATNQGITWSSAYQPGYVVIDLQEVRAFTTLRIFQMFSDGKVSAVRLSVSNATGDTWPLRDDGSWTTVVEKSNTGPGARTGSSSEYVTCPSVYDFGATKGRYIMLEAWNDGGFGSTAWVEIGAAKLFFENEVQECSESCPPDVPTQVSASAGNASATLTWSPPAASNLTGYSIQYSSNGGSSWSSASTLPSPISGSALSAQITGLSNGVAYLFRIKASNSVGDSLWSLNSNSVTPEGTFPNPPANVTATAGDTNATVSWDAVTGAVSYTVTGSPFGSCSVSAPTTTCSVTGLTNALSYTFTVKTTNGSGTSGMSDPSNAVIPFGDPDNDGDGFTVGAGNDCDDANASIYPGATEIPNNGIDEDCSGGDLIDTSIIDGDSDGYTPAQGDCNDADANINPGATEIPNNGIDEDCTNGDGIDIDNDGTDDATDDNISMTLQGGSVVDLSGFMSASGGGSVSGTLVIKPTATPASPPATVTGSILSGAVEINSTSPGNNGYTQVVTFTLGNDTDSIFTGLMKFGPTHADTTPHWYVFGTVTENTGVLYKDGTGYEISGGGKILTVYLVDGQDGDDDLVADGGIHDPAVPLIRASSAVAIPLFGPFGALLLSALMGFIGYRRLKF